jgi:hypothetical protein
MIRLTLALTLLAACGTADLTLERGAPIWSEATLVSGSCAPGRTRQAFDRWPWLLVSDDVAFGDDATTDVDLAVGQTDEALVPEPGRTVLIGEGRRMVFAGIFDGHVLEGRAYLLHDPTWWCGDAAFPLCGEEVEAACVYDVTVTAR